PYVILASGMRLQDERDGFGNERTSRDRRAFARLCRPGGLHYKEVRTLIVDDEPVARRVLREGLGSFPDVEIIGEAENGRDAVSQIGRLRPDLVFLDLKMPGLGGFDVIHQLPEGALPIVVIVTAHDAHAIQAFEAGALDYLLKPVSQERLEKAVERSRNMRGKTAEVAESLVKLDD